MKHFPPAARPARHPGRRAVVLGAVCLALPWRAWAAGESLVVGQVAPFTGPQAVTDLAIDAGANFYFNAVTARGGVRGWPIRLVTRDDAQKSDETVRLVNELIAAESPVALLGTVGTTNLEALAKDGILLRQRVSVMGAIAAIAAAGPIDVGNYLLDFSAKDRTGSRHVDFAMFGAGGKVVQ